MCGNRMDDLVAIRRLIDGMIGVNTKVNHGHLRKQETTLWCRQCVLTVKAAVVCWHMSIKKLTRFVNLKVTQCIQGAVDGTVHKGPLLIIR